jgi:arylsulfatase A-like enzyme
LLFNIKTDNLPAKIKIMSLAFRGVVLTLSGLLLLLAGCKNSPSADEPEIPGFRPNILWITCEDIGPALGCYGDPAASTPNIDRLADEGVMYTRAFSVAGVCAPGRHALITGMYPTSTGGHNMRTINHDLEGLPYYDVVLPPGVRCFSELLRQSGYYCTNNQKTDYQFQPPVTAWDECDLDAHWRKRPPGTPFFAVFNFLTTHESRIWMQQGEPLLVDEATVPIPPYFPDHPVVRRDVARKYSNITEMDRQVGIILDQLKEDGLLDSTVIFFYSDNGGMLPREKRELYDTGLKIPLLIRFPRKAGAGKINDELVSFVDFAPTVLSLAGVRIPDYMQGQAFLGKQKAQEPRKFIFGARDRMDTEYDMVRAVRTKKYKYLKNYYPDKPFVQDIEYRKQIPMMSVLYEYDRLNKFNDEQGLWWRKTKPEEELYDLEADPWEFKNLADSQAYQVILDEMRLALEEWQEKFGDKGFIPENELIREMWGGDEKPVTEPVSFYRENGMLVLYSPTPGASVAYRFPDQSDKDHWYLYTGPLKIEPEVKIEAAAIRIGYEQSGITQYLNE